MGKRYTAGGYLYHAETRRVLLHHRDATAPIYPNLWAAFGGQNDAGDREDPVFTWCREMREELGVELDPSDIVPLRDHVNPRTGRYRYVFYCAWPTLAEEFVLTEGDGFAWFSIEDALRLPDIVDLTRHDLQILRDRVSEPSGLDLPDVRGEKGA